MGTNTAATARTLRVMLDAEATAALLHEVPEVYHTQINDLLLAALARSFRDWTGASTLLLDLEGHGREDLFADMDLSRTVGWFTTIFPLLLELPNQADPGVALRAVKEQLRSIPRHGIGYGLLRYLSQESAARDALAALPVAEVSFNYLGQVDQMLPEHGLFGPAQESPGPLHSPHGGRSHLLEINAIVAAGQLQLAWTYSAAVHRSATIERLADDMLAALRALIAHCQSPDAGGFTPSDFPLLGLSQDALDEIASQARFEEIE
jgi:non-ribosomal peptide synthase protein (TIGR01720 family)